MTSCRQDLRAGEPMLLPSGRTILVIERTRLTVLGAGAWRGVVAQREPHALLLRWADGTVSVLAADSSPVSIAALRDALPSWDHVLSRLASAAPRGAPRSAVTTVKGRP